MSLFGRQIETPCEAGAEGVPCLPRRSHLTKSFVDCTQRLGPVVADDDGIA